MNLEQFREQLSSDATKENEQLKKEIKALKKSHSELFDKYTSEVAAISDDAKCLAERCYATTRGELCIFCSLHAYHCPHAMSFEEQIKTAIRLRKEYGHD